MLGLRYYACRSCATVFAEPAGPPAPTRCPDCPSGSLSVLTPQGGAARYFAPRDERND